MNSSNRFNRDEISKILKRAAELEHEDDVLDDSEGLTVEELQQVSKEVGLHPKYIQQALDELKSQEHLVSSNILGGPFTFQQTKSVNGSIQENEWEEVVAEIRRIHGGIGKTSKLGNTFEWEQRKREVGYIQVSLSPKKDHTKININASYNYYASILYTFTVVFGFILLNVLFEKLGLPYITEIVLATIGTLGLMSGTRFYLSRWMQKKRKTYSQLFLRFKEMLEPHSVSKEIDTTSSLVINTEEEKNSTDEGAGRREREQTK